MSVIYRAFTGLAAGAVAISAANAAAIDLAAFVGAGGDLSPEPCPCVCPCDKEKDETITLVERPIEAEAAEFAEVMTEVLTEVLVEH